MAEQQREREAQKTAGVLNLRPNEEDLEPRNAEGGQDYIK